MNDQEVSGDELGTSLNKVESLLSSQSSSHPALNLVVYIPPIHRNMFQFSLMKKFFFTIKNRLKIA